MCVHRDIFKDQSISEFFSILQSLLIKILLKSEKENKITTKVNYDGKETRKLRYVEYSRIRVFSDPCIPA